MKYGETFKGLFAVEKIKMSANIILTLVLLSPDIPCLCKQCRSRSVGFWRSQLIWICTVCHQLFEFIATIRIKQPDWLKIRNRCDILIYSAGQGLSVVRDDYAPKFKVGRAYCFGLVYLFVCWFTAPTSWKFGGHIGFGLVCLFICTPCFWDLLNFEVSYMHY